MRLAHFRWLPVFFTVLGLALTGACGNSTGGNPAAPSTPTPTAGVTADVVITISGSSGDRSYSPNPAALRAGQRVAWRNADSISHTATADGGAFDTGTIPPGATSNVVTISTAGSVPYHCRFHPGMVGTLTVTQ